MTTRRTLVRGLALATLVTTVSGVAGGCASERDRLGQGDDVGFCVAWVEWEGLEAPDPTDRDELLDWTAASRNIIERVNLREDVGESRPPRQLAPRLERVDREFAAFEAELEDAGDVEALRRASARLAAGRFGSDVDALTQTKDRVCTAEERRG